jgi:membrane protease YdiL (CAAX protease family)
MSKRSIIVFLATLLLVSWAWQCVMLLFVGNPDSDAAMPWLVALMFSPTLAAVVYRYAFNREAFRFVSFRPGNPAYVLLGALIPTVTGMVVVGVVLLAGWGTSEYFAFSGSTVEITRGPWLLGTGVQTWPLFAANVAATAVAFAAINAIPAFGEEFGWRGFLQKHMIDRFGLTQGVCMLGLVWAFWHLPAILAGYNYPQTPALGGFVLFPLLLTADSFVMAWLTLRARSFWPAVLMHGSINGMHEGVCTNLTLAQGIHRLHVDLIAILVSAAVAAICIWAMRRREARSVVSPAAVPA